MTWDCLCVGVLVADHLCAPLARMPAAGDLVVTDRLVLNIGGNAANTAVVLSKLGASAAVVGCIGDDIFGQYVSDTLNSAGVSTVGLRRVPGSNTAGTLIVNVAGEDRRFIHDPGANPKLTAEDITPALLKATRVLYIGGYFLASGLRPEPLKAVMQQAQQSGVLTVLDVVVPAGLSSPSDLWPLIEPLMPFTDVVKPNTDEARMMTGLSDPVAQAKRFAAAGAKTAVITCGGTGCIVATNDRVLRCGTLPTQFVDASGAGDAFGAGLIYGMLQGFELERCLAWGSALGASCVRAVGTTTSIFSKNEAEAFLDRHRLPIEVIE